MEINLIFYIVSLMMVIFVYNSKMDRNLLRASLIFIMVLNLGLSQEFQIDKYNELIFFILIIPVLIIFIYEFKNIGKI